MNFEEIHKKYFNPSEDEDSLASTTSDISFTMSKKEVTVETKTVDGDNINELVKSLEKHDEIKLDESLVDKANEIYSYMKDTSESSNPNDSEKAQDDKSLDLSLNDSDLQKVADNLESTQLDESLNEVENDSDLKEVVKNLEAAMNESFNEENFGKTNSDLNEIQSEQVEPKSEASQSESNENLARIVEDIVAPLSSLGNENLSKIASEVLQSGEKEESTEQNEEVKAEKSEDLLDTKESEAESQTEQSVDEQNSSFEANESNKSEESPSALSQIMQFVTGLTSLGSTNEKAPEPETKNEEFTDIVKEIQNDLNSSQALESTEAESVPDVADDSLKSNHDESQQSVAEENQQSELDASQISNIEEEVKQSDNEEKVEVAPSQSEPEQEQLAQINQEEQQENANELSEIDQKTEADQLADEFKEFVNQVAQEQTTEPSQDFEINISERIATLAQDLIEQPQLTEQEETSGEVRIVSEDGVEAIGCTIFAPDEIWLRKEEILNKYKINEEQFELCREFFNEKKDGSLLSNHILRSLMREAIKKRPQVKAEESDIDRALEAVDEDKDDKVTFDELVQFLLLFFSSKTNVENRIGNILKARLSSETLSSVEAVEFAGFLNKFYGHPTNDEQFKEGLNLSDFLKDVLPNLGTLAFVQPEQANEESNEQKLEQDAEKPDEENQQEEQKKEEIVEQSNEEEASQSSEAVEA